MSRTITIGRVTSSARAPGWPRRAQARLLYRV